MTRRGRAACVRRENFDELEDAMAKWEKYVNESEDHPLIKNAVAHAEFEAIHPLNDSNGRIGRIVIPLMLCAEGVMSSPCFYMSEFFEHRNNEYQDRLLAVSSDGDWTGWCSFFLEAVAAQARENLGKAKQINLLYRCSDGAGRGKPFSVCRKSRGCSIQLPDFLRAGFCERGGS